jgi:hypothetical protein
MREMHPRTTSRLAGRIPSDAGGVVKSLSAAVASLAALVLLTSVPGARPASAAKAAPTWARATAFPQPAFAPTRKIDVSTVNGFWSAWNQIRPGDEIDVHGVTFAGETILTNKHLSGWAEVHFDAGTRFVGVTGGNYPAVWIKSDSNVRFYGGTVTNPGGGAGILIYDSAWFTWWHFVIHDTGSSGLMVQGIATVNKHLDLEGDISRWGLDLGLDPHAEKGTGLHGALLADAYYGVESSRFALTLHDGATGAGVEAGGARPTDVFRDNALYLRCSRLTMRATVEVAGNCLEYWGQNVTGNVVRYLSASNLQGRAFDANGMDAGQSLRSDVVAYARASETNLNPYLARTESSIRPRQPWDTRFGTVFRNVAPR